MTTAHSTSAPAAEPGRRVVVKQDGTVTRGGVRIGIWKACHRRVRSKFVPKIEIQSYRFIGEDGRIAVVRQKWDLHAAIEALFDA